MDGKDGSQHLICKAVRKTWANQRRKRRLAATQQQSKKPKESRELDQDPQQDNQDHQHDENKKDNVPTSSQEIPIESCEFEFACIFNRTDVNLVQFKWLRGDSKDNLHQITQYLKNQAHLSVQQPLDK